uniref:xylulokinase n=1 Tax=Caenibacillus caldisaponilyticus TaxID=1674942 RepID=UPI0011780438
NEIALKNLLRKSGIHAEEVKGISFSGQMHGLVLLDEIGTPLRRAILWNDTRTSAECREIEATVGLETLLKNVKNRAFEGFTLPKILWVKRHEPDIFRRAVCFLLPKDYVRFRLTGKMAIDFSDAAGTLLLDIEKKEWSRLMCDYLGIAPDLCPPLVDSTACVGHLLSSVAEEVGLSENTKVFAGGADNACGALGAGILSEGNTLCSIGTSGVVLSYESRGDHIFDGSVHYFNHVEDKAYYIMGVTLAAGYSLDWFKRNFIPDEGFEKVIHQAFQVDLGAGGLLFTPYIVGERTPYADSDVRGSFIGVDVSHTTAHFARAVIEGITFSLNESIEILRNNGKKISSIVSIGGGAKSDEWLQLQADIFNAPVLKLESEQGPAMGAAMIAAYGCGWFNSLKECADAFIRVKTIVEPRNATAERYAELFKIYKDIYRNTQPLTSRLKNFRK